MEVSCSEMMTMITLFLCVCLSVCVQACQLGDRCCRKAGVVLLGRYGVNGLACTQRVELDFACGDLLIRDPRLLWRMQLLVGFCGFGSKRSSSGAVQLGTTRCNRTCIAQSASFNTDVQHSPELIHSSRRTQIASDKEKTEYVVLVSWLRTHLAAEVEGFGVCSAAEKILHDRLVPLRRRRLKPVGKSLLSLSPDLPRPLTLALPSSLSHSLSHALPESTTAEAAKQEPARVSGTITCSRVSPFASNESTVTSSFSNASLTALACDQRVVTQVKSSRRRCGLVTGDRLTRTLRERGFQSVLTLPIRAARRALTTTSLSIAPSGSASPAIGVLGFH
eukprot:3939083-Rhodomonas_salina.2